KKAYELGYLAAFHIEDLYHRGIEPNFSVVMNRLRQQFPELIDKLTDSQKRDWFKLGEDYVNTNVADPLFSRLKQDAVEKLPNRFTAEQALNVIGGEANKNEFEWTAGLNEFLENAKSKGEK